MLPTSQNISIIKQFAFKAFAKVEELSNKRIQNSIVKWFWNQFGVGHFKNLIMTTDDILLKQDLKEIYNILEPLFKEVEVSKGILEGEALGSIKIPRLGQMKIDAALLEGIEI